MLATVTVVGIIVLAILIWLFVRTRSQDLLATMMEKRRGSSRIVSRAEYIEGLNRIPVALSLSNDSLFYENPDLQASFELARIEEVEYDDELTTGRSVPQGVRALRLRAHGTTFEFIMPTAETVKWESALPPRGGQPQARVS